MLASPRRPGSRALRAFRFPLAAFVVLLGLIGGSFALFSGCALATGGVPATDGGTACTGGSFCNDDNPCTTDACGSDGFCEFTAVADGPAVAGAQTAGDCQIIQCSGGLATTANDDTDVPNSNNPCVADSCSMGAPVHNTSADNGHACQSNGLNGTCKDGTCNVICQTASQCITSNTCVTPSCDGATGMCSFMPLPDGTKTPGATQATGDCHVHICIMGADTDAEDDSDVPAQKGDCQDPICTSGTPGQKPHALDSGCSTFQGSSPGYCDGAGACVQCTKGNECPGPVNDCQQPSCTASVCGTTFTPTGTATTSNPPQVAGDCHKLVCDGKGGTTSAVDDTDAANSGTVCITDKCSNGSGTETINAGVMCGGTTGMSETCSSTGMCGCMSNADCTAPNTCGGGNPGTPLFCGCTKTTCAAKNVTCGSTGDACFGSLACNDGKQDGTETDVDCGGVAAAGSTCAVPCAQGKKCSVTSDCMSGLTCADGVCCNSACNTTCEACTAAKKGQGADGVCGAVKVGLDPHNQCPMAAQSTCGDVGGCNGAGACTLYGNGLSCTTATCMSSLVVLKADLCDGNGACKAQLNPTQDCTPYRCSSGACTTSCTMDFDCANGSYYCNASHACVLKLTDGTACTGSGATTQCVSGTCVDGVCCHTACNTACQACSAALTGGTNGTCGPAMDGSADPRGLCGTTLASTCKNDGKCQGGACEKWPSTTVCTPASCSPTTDQQTTATSCDGAGNCNQGGVTSSCNGLICGSSACLTSCAASDANCVSGDYCTASNTCQARGGPGAACTTNDQCTGAGLCLGGFCCSTGCTMGGTCGAMACTPGSGPGAGACVYPPALTGCPASGGTCLVDTLDTFPVCDGAGTCRTVAATVCPVGACTTAGCSSCLVDASCTSYGYCSGAGADGGTGTCMPKGQPGAACTVGTQCLDGTCQGNTTCN